MKTHFSLLSAKPAGALVAAFCLHAATAPAWVLSVRQCYQEHTNWCWAATSQAVLAFYGKNYTQLQIAEYGTGGLDTWDYAYGSGWDGGVFRRGVDLILTNFGPIYSIPLDRALSLSEAGSDINVNGRPIPIRWEWSTGGGHILVLHGLTNMMAYLMDPWDGPTVNTYAWVTNGGGHIWTHTLRLTTVSPPTIIVPPQSQTVVEGTNVSFTVQVIGTPPFWYQWISKDGLMSEMPPIITGTTNATLTILHVPRFLAGPYFVGVATTGGPVYSPPALLTVLGPIQWLVNTATNGQTLNLAAGAYNDTAVIDKNLTFIGADATNTLLHGYGTGPVLQINSNATVALRSLTIIGGSSSNTAGGIANFGTLTLDNCVIRENQGSLSGQPVGGGIENQGDLTLNNSDVCANAGMGGGIINLFGTLRLTNCTVRGNWSGVGTNGWLGGGICSQGTLIAENTTISGNTGAAGGGLYAGNGTVILSHCTVCSNSASGQAGGIYAPVSPANVGLQSTLIAGNTAPVGPDCWGLLNSQGYNLIQNTNGCAISGPATGDLYGLAPLLGPLQDNGGPTWTHALRCGSPAIDQGTVGSLATDQRGVSRPWNLPGVPNAADGSDIGAYELVNHPPQVSLTSPTNGTVVNPSNPITLQATATDPGGSVVKVEYYDGPTNLVGSATQSPFTCVWQCIVPGDHLLAAVATDDCGITTTSAPVSISVLAWPIITRPPTNQTVVAGQTATFTVEVTGSPPLGYFWWFNSTSIPDATNSTLTITNAQQTNAGSYRVTVANMVGYVNSDPATLTVIDPPRITTQPASRTNLWDTTATFAASVGGTEPLTCQWQFNGTNLSDTTHIVGSRTNCLAIPNVVFADAGDYRLLVTNPAGSITSSVATLTVQPASISLTNGDVLGSSSFAAKLNWNSSSAPAARNAYFTAGYLLRTPQDASDYSFQGESLQVDPKTGGGSALTFKGTGLITVNTLKLNGATLGNGIDAVARLAGNLTNQAASCFDCVSAARSFDLSAALSGTAPITNINGLVAYSGANGSFAGKMVATSSGIIQVDSEARLGANPASFTADQLLLDNGTLGITATFALDDSNRGISLGAAGGTFDTATNTTLTIPNPITGAGALTKKGAGMLVLSGVNTITGALNVDTSSTGTSDGIVKITTGAAIAQAASPIQVRNNNNGSSTLQLDGSSGGITVTQDVRLACRLIPVPWLENLSGTNTLAGNISCAQGGNQYWCQSDTGLLRLNGWIQYQPTTGSANSARTNAFTGSGDFLVAGAILDSTNGAPVHLLKTGAGALTLAGTNTYAASTTVLEGTLRLTGSINSTGGVAVAGGTLSGTGVINDNLTVQAGGVLSPGYDTGSIGSLTVNGSLTNCGVILMDLNKAGAVLTNDTITSVGTMAYGGTLQLAAGGAALAAGDSFKLFYAGSYGGAFANLVPPTPGAGLVWDTSSLATSGTLAVGEPPQISGPPASQWVIAGSDATFTVTAAATPPPSYQWRFNGTNLPWASRATCTVTNAQLADGGLYDVVVANGVGSVTSAAATLTVLVAPTLSAAAYNAATLQFQFEITGNAGSNYVVEACSNLGHSPWIPLLTNPSPFTFIDTNVGHYPQRFYRAGLVP